MPGRAPRAMSGVSRDAPLGVQALQRLSGALCPRLKIDRLFWYRASVLALTYAAYTTFHMTRKPLSVVKSVLHRNCSALAPPAPGAPPTWCDWAPFDAPDATALLGALDSAFLFAYAGAMFLSGLVAERVDLRYFLALGMLLSAGFCYLFGAARSLGVHRLAYFVLVQAGAGVAQTSGWPGCVAAVGKWFGGAKKGLVFGVWNSHTSLGNILGSLLAARYVEGDWALSFMYPAAVMGGAAALVWLLLVPEPAHVGLAPGVEPERAEAAAEPEDEAARVLGASPAGLRPSRHSTNAPRDAEAGERAPLLGARPPQPVSLARALAIPGVVQFSLSLFFAKLVSYTFLYWLPLYINTSTALSASESAQLSAVFDAGGAAGAVLAGLLADASGAPALVCVGFYALSAPALGAYRAWGAASYGGNAALLAASGALVNGPYALITTAVSAELGAHASLAGDARALATVAAIVDGTGSVGAALGPLLAGLAAGGASGWDRVFLLLVACDVAALLLLLRTALAELRRLRQERRLASPPRVRVE